MAAKQLNKPATKRTNTPSITEKHQRVPLAEMIVLAMLLGCFFLAGYVPYESENARRGLWGVSLYRYLPKPALLLLFALSAITLVPGLNRAVLAGLNFIGKYFGWFPRAPWIRALFIGLSAFGLCYLFDSKTFLLGDGTVLVGMIGFGREFYSTNLVDYYLHFKLGKLIGGAPLAYLWISSLAGGGYAIISYFIARRLVNNGAQIALSFCWLISVGAMAQFFGYAESYSILLVVLQGYALSLIVFLDKKKSSLFVPFLLASLCGCLHLTATLVSLSAAYLLYLRLRESGNDRVRLVLSAALGYLIPIIIIGSIFYRAGFDFSEIVTDSQAKRPVLLSFLPFGERGAYWVFAPGHLLDILNQYLLAMPAFMLLPFVLESKANIANHVRSNSTKLIALAAFCLVAFFFCMDNKLASYRDWDVMAIPMPMLAVLILLLLVRGRRLHNPGRLLRMTCLNLAILVPFIAVNADEKRAVARYADLSDVPGLHRYRVEYAYNFYILAKYYKFERDSEKSLAYILRAAEIDPQERFFEFAMDIYRKGSRFGEALETLKNANTVLPNSPVVLDLLGEVYTKNKLFPEAKKCFEKAIALDPSPEYYFNFGICLSRSGDLMEAMGPLDKAFELTKSDPEFRQSLYKAWVYNGQALAGQRMFVPATHCFERAAQINPDSLSLKKQLGACYFLIDRYAEALGVYNGLLSRFPDDLDSWMGAGKVYHLLGNKPEADSCFNEAVRLLKENDLLSSLELANTLFQVGRFDLSERCTLRVLQISPGHPEATARLERLRAIK